MELDSPNPCIGRISRVSSHIAATEIGLRNNDLRAELAEPAQSLAINSVANLLPCYRVPVEKIYDS